MGLFGAASSGVDPQTGSYLTKEQRIAMFNASRGRGNSSSGGSGDSSSSGPKREYVSTPVQNFVYKTLLKFKSTISEDIRFGFEGIAIQVKNNTEAVKNLYKLYEEAQEAFLESQEQKNDNQQLQIEGDKRRKRENLIEGFSKAVAKAAEPVMRVAATVGKNLNSIWDKIKSFLLRIAGAWIFDNLPSILESLGNFGENIGNLYDVLSNNAWSIRGIGGAVGKIVQAATDVAITIGKKAYSIADNIWKASKGARSRIGKALKSFVTGTVDFLKDRLSSLYRGAKKIFERVLPRSASNADDVGRRALPPAKNALQRFISSIPIPNWVSDTGKTIKNAFGSISNAAQSGMEGLKNFGGSIRDKLSLLKPADNTKEGVAARNNWLKKALKPVTQMFGSEGLERLVKMVTRAPVVGAVIDTLLNANVEGQGMMESIMRGVLSGGAGTLGWTGGAYVGSGIGFALGSVVPVVGNAAGALIGGALGGIVGSMALGAAGDKLGAIAYEGVSGEKSKTNEGTEAILGLLTNPFGNNSGSTDAPVVPVEPIQSNENVTAQITSTVAGKSTPDGMFMPFGDESFGDVTNYIEMPPEMTQIPMGKKEQQSGVKYDNAPSIPTSDSEMDFYRSLSMKNYDLVYTGG